MQSVKSILKLQPPATLEVCVRSTFYYRISGGELGYGNCYLADSSSEGEDRLVLSDSVGEFVIEEDETFGMMVGGEYAYFGLEVELRGFYRSSEGGPEIDPVTSLSLRSGDLVQEFFLN